jgi:hypothetical protein
MPHAVSLFFTAKHRRYTPIPCRQEGRFANVTNEARVAMGAVTSLDE